MQEVQCYFLGGIGDLWIGQGLIISPLLVALKVMSVRELLDLAFLEEDSLAQAHPQGVWEMSHEHCSQSPIPATPKNRWSKHE